MDRFVCTFAGHRQVFAPGIPQRLDAIMESLLARHGELLFYSGGMGEFDSLCEAAVWRAKRAHAQRSVRLVLVLPYMKQSINTHKAFYEERYDDVIVPGALAGAHYKAAIPMRNLWMLNHADALIAYVVRDFGGAYEALCYAKKRARLEIVNLAE